MAEFELKKRAFQFTTSVIKTFAKVDMGYELKFLKSQLYRSVSSIGANLVEGGAGSSRKMLIQYYRIALRSSRETGYWLQLISEIFPEIDKQTLDSHLSECESISRILGKTIVTLNNQSSK